MLELTQIAKQFNGSVALHALDLNFAHNTTTVLIGPSGCGKSTLLRMIAGLVQPDSGSIRFEGEPLTRDNINDLRHRMGYVIQEGGLFPHLTVQGNVTLMARYLKWPVARIDARLQELAQLVRLTPDMFTRYPAELSGGQRQRVSLMRALMLDPDVLLLDEPLGALDPMIRYELQQELRDIFKQIDKTVVMVTHDIAEAAFFADKLADSIVLLREGRVVQQGSLRDLVQSPAEPFVGQFMTAQREPLEHLQKVLR